MLLGVPTMSLLLYNTKHEFHYGLHVPRETIVRYGRYFIGYQLCRFYGVH